MESKWVCNKCGFVTNEKPEHKNSTCQQCKKGRFRQFNLCDCGEWFHPDKAEQPYCSKECGYKYRHSGGKKGKHYPHTQRARIAVCPICGKEFRAINECKGHETTYCSKECWSIRGTIVNKCLYCGKEIVTSKSANKLYCCKKCYSMDMRERASGANSHFWKGGKTKESKLRKTSAKYKEWRTSVFARDNYTCQKCGKRTSNLEAHHIKEQCNFPELIYDIDNGVTLCRECHKETDNYGNKIRHEQFTGSKAVLLNGEDGQAEKGNQ